MENWPKFPRITLVYVQRLMISSILEKILTGTKKARLSAMKGLGRLVPIIQNLE